MNRALAPTDPAGELVGNIHVVVEGDRSRPAIALVHGIPGSTRDFRYLGPLLADAGVCAVRVDMPGFGKTPMGAFPSTKPLDRATFVRQVMRALGFKHFAVGGHSFGGGQALLCAAMFPDDVTAVVFMNSIGPRRHRGFGMPPSMYRVFANALSTPVIKDVVHTLAVQGYSARGLKSDVELTPAIVKHHAEIIGNCSFPQFRLACPMVRAPSLVVSAADDPLVEEACSFALARALTSASTVTHIHTKKGGHFNQKHEAHAITRWLRERL